MKVLLTSTSFQDTPGKHQELLSNTGFSITNLRGPLSEEIMLQHISDYDALICGDDEITDRVLKLGAENKLVAISKYGVGLDKIDLLAAKKYNIPISNCLGVNHIAVSEHVIALLLTFYKNIHIENNITREGRWKRLIGHEVYGQNFGIIGLGSIGKEVAKRASAFGMNIFVYDKFIDLEFIKSSNIKVCNSLEELVESVSIISLNLSLNYATKGIFSMNLMKNSVNKNTVLINTARAGLIDLETVIYGLENKILSAYLTDVLEKEPMVENHPLLKFENVIITPHIGSRTYESVERQGTMAVENLLNLLNKK